MRTMLTLQRQLNTINTTLHMTRAMKLLATAKLKEARERVLAARPFAQKLAEVMNELAILSPPTAYPLLARRLPKRRLGLVVFTADRGLCGDFNNQLVRTALNYQAQNPAISVDYLTVGTAGYRLLKRQSCQIVAHFPDMVTHPRFKHAQAIAHAVMARYQAEEWDEVSLVYAKFYSALEQRPRVFELLPLEPEKATRPREVMQRGMVLYEPNAQEILEPLFIRYVETEIYRALLETHAGEYGARMAAMTAATDNAQEIKGRLQIQLQRARQGIITTELSEIVGGAEALAANNPVRRERG